jgi:hypothetical protein
MRIKEVKLYKFNELSDDAKDKAIKKLWDITVANKIITDHGPDCDTFKTAKNYLTELTELREHANDDKDLLDECDDEPDTTDIDSEFLKSLLEDYRIILQKEYEYLTGKPAIIEMIEANDYEFTEDGTLD